MALDRNGLELHYFGIPGFLAEDSYGSCVVITDDIEALFDAFAAGLRAAYGKLRVSGFPRITRPRRRKNNDNRTRFSLVDPSGNWIRVAAERSPVESSSDASVSRLRAVVDNAVVIADSHGDAAQAAKILAGALARDTTARPEERREAEEYWAELRERLVGPCPHFTGQPSSRGRRPLAGRPSKRRRRGGERHPQANPRVTRRVWAGLVSVSQCGPVGAPVPG
jgi:hypothetical protein